MRIRSAIRDSSHSYMVEGTSASITLGDVTMVRTERGWTVQTDGPVDLVQLEAAVQWAKAAPAASATTSPLAVVDGEGESGDVVTEARDLLAEQGGFGADMFSSEDALGGPTVTSPGGTVDVEQIRTLVMQAEFHELEAMCEAACTGDDSAGTDILEMALEERVAKMLRTAATGYGCFHVPSDKIRYLTWERVQKESINPGRCLPVDEGLWKARHNQLLGEVEYLEDVRAYLHTRRQEPVGDWGAWRVNRIAQRARQATFRDLDEIRAARMFEKRPTDPMVSFDENGLPTVHSVGNIEVDDEIDDETDT
jgi:hypothetical protein